MIDVWRKKSRVREAAPWAWRGFGCKGTSKNHLQFAAELLLNVSREEQRGRLRRELGMTAGARFSWALLCAMPLCCTDISWDAAGVHRSKACCSRDHDMPARMTRRSQIGWRGAARPIARAMPLGLAGWSCFIVVVAVVAVCTPVVAACTPVVAAFENMNSEEHPISLAGSGHGEGRAPASGAACQTERDGFTFVRSS